MAVSIVQKSTGQARGKSKVALVLSGGAVSGGAFKAGGLLALDHLLSSCRVTDFDIYVGISAGSMLAAPLAGGIRPQELVAGFTGGQSDLPAFGAMDFYRPNLRETLSKSFKAAKDLATLWPELGRSSLRVMDRRGGQVKRSLANLFKHPGTSAVSELLGPFLAELRATSDLPYPSSYIPSGLFSNTSIEKWIRRTFDSRRIPNNFRLLKLERGVSLYVEAADLDTGEEVVFGPDEDQSVSISEAIMASTALPGFYRPVKIRDRYYVDGSVRHTAPMEIARRKDADLIIIYNPFRPYRQVPTKKLVPNFESIGEMGLITALNQSIRTMIHSRLHLGIEELRKDPGFKGDVILFEPSEDDADFFTMNPFAFWERAEAARKGYRSARHDIEKNFPGIKSVLTRHGLDCKLSTLQQVDDLLLQCGNDEADITRTLAREWPKEKGSLRLVHSA